jgi:hypothetical protein
MSVNIREMQQGGPRIQAQAWRATVSNFKMNPTPVIRTLRRFTLGDLQRNDAIQACVADLPYLAHAAFA